MGEPCGFKQLQNGGFFQGKCQEGLTCVSDVPGAKADAHGICKPCLCPYLLEPVCGTDGKTYPNKCSAGCDDVRVACQGICPCPWII